MGRTQRRRAAPRSRQRRRRRSQRGGKLFDVQKLLTKTGMELHWPGYHYMGPGTHLEKRLARGDPGINRLDPVQRQQRQRKGAVQLFLQPVPPFASL